MGILRVFPTIFLLVSVSGASGIGTLNPFSLLVLRALILHVLCGATKETFLTVRIRSRIGKT